MKNLHPGCVLAMTVLAACDAGADAAPDTAAAMPASVSSLCATGGESYLRAQLRGAIVADLDWSSDTMTCEGGPRPDGRGLRAAMAGKLTAAEAATPRPLRLVFGIRLEDIASGEAQALPTNLTVIVEGEKTLFATLGDDKCASELVERRALLADGGGRERIVVRGYCVGPATDATGERRLLVPTFEFATVINMGDGQ
jgi:hypothetical protein